VMFAFAYDTGGRQRSVWRLPTRPTSRWAKRGSQVVPPPPFTPPTDEDIDGGYYGADYTGDVEGMTS